MANASTSASTVAEPGKRRPLVPIVLVALETAALAGLQYAEAAEWLSPANAMLAKLSSVGLTLILLFLWFVLLAPVARVVRARVAIVAAVLAAVGFATLRIEGVSGDIVPRLRFRWSPHADQTLGKIPAGDDAADAVNLAETTPEDYAQFMGPNRLGTLSGASLGRDWSAAPPKPLWRQPIGAAWSAFSVVGPFAVTQEQRGEEELITCYEVATGKTRWAHSTPVRFEETLAGIGPRATPTVVDGKVYAMGAKGHVTCLDGATGKPLWQRDVVTENKAVPPIWGKSCSPLVLDNLVIISAGGPAGKSLVALDRASGEVVWSGGDDASSYSSPMLVTLCGVPQVVIANAKTIAGHDPADGRVLWQESWPAGALERDTATPTVSQPISVGDDRLLLTKGYGEGAALWKIKREGDAWSVEQLWRNNNLKTKFTSAVIRDGFAYALDEGVLECVEIDSGRKTWKRGKYGHGQVLLVDDLLLVQAEDGDVALVEASPQAYRELTRFHAIDGTCWNPPALSGRKLLVRSNEEAACYELPAASP